jgi:hypothetical protein
MAFNKPFAFLKAEEVRYLTDSDHRQDREVYVDCLAFMHDLLTDLGTIPNQPRFDIKEIRRSYKRAVEDFSKHAQNIRLNVEVNFKTGIDLHSEITAFHNVGSYTSRTLADKFIDDLLEQYRVIRYPKIP